MDLSLGINCLDMVGHKALEVTRSNIDGVSIVVSLASTQLVAPLPEEISSHASSASRRVLPRLLDAAVIARCSI